jgi:hypothetical protein
LVGYNEIFSDSHAKIAKAKIAKFKAVLQNAPNKACTRRWGFWRDSKHFSTPQHFSSRTAFRRPPQRG